MNRKSQQMSLQTIVGIIILLTLLIIVITFVSGQLGDMFGGLGTFGTDVNESLGDVEIDTSTS